MTHHRVEFTESENPWAPTAIIEEINERTGSGLVLTGLAEQTGGISSAAFVRWPDGREGALTRSDLPLTRMQQTAELLSTVRSSGVFVPRHDLVIELSDGRLGVLQERLSGRHRPIVDAETIAAVVAAGDQFAGLLADRPDVPIPAFHLRATSPEDEQWHQTLARYDARSRHLLDRIREIGAEGPYEMVGDDLLHTDYNIGNILFDDRGQVCGVVDWNLGAARGDRRYALLGLRNNLAAEGDPAWVTPDAEEYLDWVLSATIAPNLLRAYWAALTLGMVHHLICGEFPAERIEQAISLGEARLA